MYEFNKDLYVIIFVSLILNLFVPTHDIILCTKCLLCIYVPSEDGSRRPKHVGGITMTKQIYMHEYLQLVRINTV